MPSSQSLIITLVFLLITGFPSQPAVAGDHTFQAVVQVLKREYHLQPKSVPGMWLAECVLRAMQPSGLSEVDLVLFEEPDFGGRAAATDLGARIQTTLGAGWTQFVHFDAPKRQERAFLFARPQGRHMELFVLSLEAEEGVALFARVHPESFRRMIDHPTSAIPGKN